MESQVNIPAPPRMAKKRAGTEKGSPARRWFRVQARRLGRQDPIGTNGGSRLRSDEVRSETWILGEPLLPRKAARRAPLVIVL